MCALVTGVQTCALPIFRFEHTDCAGLLLEERGDVPVEGAGGVAVGGERRRGLADAVDAVLGLPVVPRHPVEVVVAVVGRRGEEIGSASCRDRGCQYVERAWVGGYLQVENE